MMSFLGLTDYLIGSLLVVGNVTLLGLVLTGLKKSPKVTVIFLCHMSVAGVAFGILIFARGFYVTFHVTDFVLCQIGAPAAMCSCGVYTTNLVFMYVELYLSIKNMTLKTSAISRRSAVLATLAGDVFWLGASTLGLNFIHKIDLPEYQSCDFSNASLFNTPYLLTIYGLFSVVILAMASAHLLAIRQIQQSSRSPGASDQSGFTAKVLRSRARSLRGMLLVLLTYTVCWTSVLVVYVLTLTCTACHVDYWARFVYFFNLIFTALPIIVNSTLYVVRNQTVHRMYRRITVRAANRVTDVTGTE